MPALGALTFFHNSREAIRAPSAIAFSLADVIFGSTTVNPAKFENAVASRGHILAPDHIRERSTDACGDRA